MIDTKQKIKQIRGIGILLIFISALGSFLLATTVDMTHYELGGLINYFWPPIVGAATLLLFLIATFITKNVTVIKIVLIISCIYNLYIGTAFHFEKGNWPLVDF